MPINANSRIGVTRQDAWRRVELILNEAVLKRPKSETLTAVSWACKAEAAKDSVKASRAAYCGDDRPCRSSVSDWSPSYHWYTLKRTALVFK